MVREIAFAAAGSDVPVTLPAEEVIILGEDRAGNQVSLQQNMGPLLIFFILMVETFALAGLVASEIQTRTVTAVLIRGVSWVFTAAIRASDALANYVGHGSEFEADQRVVRMGFGRELASALRQMMATRPSRRPRGWRGRLSASHPPARTRVARIEALLRHPAR